MEKDIRRQSLFCRAGVCIRDGAADVRGESSKLGADEGLERAISERFDRVGAHHSGPSLPGQAVLLERMESVETPVSFLFSSFV